MNLNNIPDELKALRQWVGVGVDSKVPMRIDTLYSASSTNPDTWCTFTEAVKAIELGEITYPGFVFNDNGIVAIDIDDGYDEDGFMSELAADIIGKCKSYTEKSKSGRGFHILLYGDLPFKGKNNLKGVEIYKTARYFIMTGDVILFNNIVENQDAIDYIVDKYFPDMRESESNRATNTRIYTPIWVKTEGKIGLRPEYPPIPDGTRNISLTSIAGQWHSLGYNKEEIYRELLYVNSIACHPPLDVSEIQCITNSVTRYKR
jgi:primase-polymerase (primpol)-like protein